MIKSWQENLPAPLRSLSTGRLVTIGLVFLLAAFLTINGLKQTATPDQVGGLAAQSFLVLALLSFFGGLISFVSPCTLPILPAYFAFATQSGRSRIAVNTIAFMLGVATMFSLLGASASALGRLLLQNQQLLLLFGGAIVMVFGVMSLLGKGFTGFKAQSNTTHSATPGGSYVFGLTFSIGWSSCVGPILGVVLTLAASSGSVFRGMILLFIYALGLGLPLIIVSTFFGRASRKSLFWRLLKGKGWQWNTHAIVAALVYALAGWRILVAIVDYAFATFDIFAGRPFTLVHEIGILLIAVAAAALWVFTTPGNRRTTLELHSTQTFSGILFILMAVLMLNGALANFNSLIPPELAVWFAGLEDRIIEIFS